LPDSQSGAGPPLPPVPLIVIAATNHGDTPGREAHYGAMYSGAPLGALAEGKVHSRRQRALIQNDRPEVVDAAVLSVAAEIGADVAACRR
jgi:hypothetical protein